MTALVRGDYVQAGGEAESHAADERVRKADASEIDRGVAVDELANLVLRCQELRRRVRQRRRLSRPDLFGSCALEPRLDRRLERADEPAADDAGNRRPAP